MPSSERSKIQFPGRGELAAFTITYATWYTLNEKWIMNS